MKPGRDEDLHTKFDEILSRMENQKDLEKKIDSLREEFVASREDVKFFREELKKVTEGIGNSKEMLHLKDSVETCVGYQELFVKDFEKIHERVQEIKGECSVKFDELEQKLEEHRKYWKWTRETGNIGIGVKNIEKNFENFERNVIGITENGRKLVGFGEKMEKMEKELKGKIDLISKTIIEIHKNLEMEVKPIILKSNETKKGMDEKLAKINKKEENIAETNLKNFNRGTLLSKTLPVRQKGVSKFHSNEIEKKTEKDGKLAETNEKEQNVPEKTYKCRWCTSILPNDLILRKDGVSVQCPNCPYRNIVGELKEGHKWMFMKCNVAHFDQFPLDKHHGDKGKCRICGKKGEINDANCCTAVPF